jgi:hypothetical protein
MVMNENVVECGVLPVGLTADRVRAALMDGGRGLIEGSRQVKRVDGLVKLPSWFGVEAKRAQVCPVVEVSPGVAEAWLRRNEGNRVPSEAKVKRYAAMMREGDWDAGNGESIKFSAGGRLLDGQSRLRAVVESGCTVEMMVVLGIAEASQDTMDVGEVRSLQHALQMRGYKNLTNMASAVRQLWGYLWNGFTSESMRGQLVHYLTHKRGVDLVECDHPGLLDSLRYVSGKHSMGGSSFLAPGSVVGGALCDVEGGSGGVWSFFCGALYGGRAGWG